MKPTLFEIGLSFIIGNEMIFFLSAVIVFVATTFLTFHFRKKYLLEKGEQMLISESMDTEAVDSKEDISEDNNEDSISPIRNHEQKENTSEDAEEIKEPAVSFNKYRLPFIIFFTLSTLSLIPIILGIWAVISYSSGNVSPSFPMSSYGLFLVLAFAAGTIWMIREARLNNINPNDIINLAAICAVFGIIGARIFYIELETGYVGIDEKLLHYYRITEGGLSGYGGLLFASFAGMTYILIRRLPFYKILDMAAPALGCGVFLIAIGSFLAGCSFGVPSHPDNDIAVSWDAFDSSSPAYSFYGPSDTGTVEAQYFSMSGEPVDVILAGKDSEPGSKLWNTQLMTSFNGFILMLLLFLGYKYRWIIGKGNLFILFLVYYGTTSFLLDYFRADSIPIFWGWTPFKFMSACTALSGIILSGAFSLSQKIAAKLENRKIQEPA